MFRGKCLWGTCSEERLDAHAGLQVSMCSDYDLVNTQTHTQTERQLLTDNTIKASCGT